MTTPMDALEQTLRSAAVFQQAAEAAPEAVLWCDEPADFIPILPALRARLPQLLDAPVTNQAIGTPARC